MEEPRLVAGAAVGRGARGTLLLLLTCAALDGRALGFGAVPSRSRSPRVPRGGAGERTAFARPREPGSCSRLYYERGDREREFPEQYPATYELQPVRNWMEVGDARLVRPLLKNTQLESRPLQVSYDAKWQGWNPQAFHRAVDGKGAAVVLCKAGGRWFGGYNPKGWSGNGGARPSVAAFLWYQSPAGGNRLVKLRKVGGGGLACARDDPDAGVWLGPDGLVVPLSGSRPREVSSRLGTYYEHGADDRYSLLPDGASTLEELKVLTGVYKTGETIPYSGAVMDFTSG